MRLTLEDIRNIAEVFNFRVTTDSDGQIVLHTGHYDAEAIAAVDATLDLDDDVEVIDDFGNDNSNKDFRRDVLGIVDEDEDTQIPPYARNTRITRNIYGGFGAVPVFTPGF